MGHQTLVIDLNNCPFINEAIEEAGETIQLP
jgi:hypothetical protein